MWSMFDYDGLGLISYRKVEECLKKFMNNDQYLSIKHVVLRAFTVAKLSRSGQGSKRQQDFITK